MGIPIFLLYLTGNFQLYLSPYENREDVLQLALAMITDRRWYKQKKEDDQKQLPTNVVSGGWALDIERVDNIIYVKEQEALKAQWEYSSYLNIV